MILIIIVRIVIIIKEILDGNRIKKNRLFFFRDVVIKRREIK